MRSTKRWGCNSGTVVYCRVGFTGSDPVFKLNTVAGVGDREQRKVGSSLEGTPEDVVGGILLKGVAKKSCKIMLG